MHNLFLENKPEYCLLKALRCHVEVDLYASFEVHTDQTIAAGRAKVAQFYDLMKVGLVALTPILYLTYIHRNTWHLKNWTPTVRK